MFWRKREEDFKELCEAYREQIAAQDNRIQALERKPYYVTIPVPETEEQQQAYLQAVATLDTNEYLMYHLVDTWERITQEFVSCRDSSKAEYYRGKLDAINQLILDGRKCRKVVGQ